MFASVCVNAPLWVLMRWHVWHYLYTHKTERNAFTLPLLHVDVGAYLVVGVVVVNISFLF